MRQLGVTMACVGARDVAGMSSPWDTLLAKVAEMGGTSLFPRNVRSKSFARTKGPSAPRKFQLVSHVNLIAMVRNVFVFGLH
jgi:hypothetical protein